MSESTLIMIKPDAFSKGVVGKALVELEKEGLQMIGCRQIKLTKERAGEFYREHAGKEFFSPLADFMSSNPILVTVWSGKDAVRRARDIIGSTDPAEAREGTVRRRWAENNRHNIIHGSDSVLSAEREIEFFFPGREGVYSWEKKEYKL